MTKNNSDTELKHDEFSKIFDEYRTKIDEIARRSEKGFQSTNTQPENNGTDDNEHIEIISLPSKDEATVNEDIPEQSEPPPPIQSEPSYSSYTFGSQAEKEPAVSKESAKILENAQREAKRITEEAEEKAKKEAKKKIKSHVEKITEKAQKEAAEIIAQANRDAEKVRKEATEIIDRVNQDAEKSREEVITESKREADYIIRDITEKYRQQTEEQASRTIAEAQEKASNMLADVSESTRQVGEYIKEIVNKAKQMISDMETNLQTEADELSKIVTETQAKLEEFGIIAIEEIPTPEPPGQTNAPKDSPAMAIRLKGETSHSKSDNGIIFSGHMEMRSIPESFDYQYLKKLKKHLTHIPNIKYIQEYASEKEISVVFDVLEPLPLLNILKNIPMVSEVITRADDNIYLVFKNAE